MANNKFLDLTGLKKVIDWQKATFVQYNSDTHVLSSEGGGGNIKKLAIDSLIMRGIFNYNAQSAILDAQSMMFIEYDGSSYSGRPLSSSTIAPNQINVSDQGDGIYIKPNGIVLSSKESKKTIAFLTNGSTYDLSEKADKVDLIDLETSSISNDNIDKIFADLA